MREEYSPKREYKYKNTEPIYSYEEYKIEELKKKLEKMLLLIILMLILLIIVICNSDLDSGRK